MTLEEFKRENPNGFQFREEEIPVEKLEIFKFSDGRERIMSSDPYKIGCIVVCDLCGHESEDCYEHAGHDLGEHIVNWQTGERQ